jgi:hypothetical protein
LAQSPQFFGEDALLERAWKGSANVPGIFDVIVLRPHL